MHRFRRGHRGLAEQVSAITRFAESVALGIERLEQRRRDDNETIGELAGAVNDLRDELTKCKHRLDDSWEGIAELRDELHELATTVTTDTANTIVDAFLAPVRDIGELLAKEIDNTNARLATIIRAIEAHERRLDALERRLPPQHVVGKAS